MNSSPDAPIACATASAGGNTTAAGWNTEPLCTSSCSTTCAAAAFTIAAKKGFVILRLTKSSDLPSDGPINAVYLAIALTARADEPARMEAIVSRNKSSQRIRTDSGMSEYFSSEANFASVALGCKTAAGAGERTAVMRCPLERTWKTKYVFSDVR